MIHLAFLQLIDYYQRESNYKQMLLVIMTARVCQGVIDVITVFVVGVPLKI